MSFVLGGEDVPEGSLPFVVAFTHVRFRLFHFDFGFNLGRLMT